MLQQTQVERVRTKFVEFIERFPDIHTLATAELAAVLAVWQGLGYNRRALALKKAATVIVEQFAGIIPDDPKELETLSGIGRYTAGAIAAFAFNHPVPFIETNIRSVYFHYFYNERMAVHDRELLPLIEATMDRENPRQWYNALMDYGAALKREHPNPSRKSLHHCRQSPFAGSNRQLRSAILRTILTTPGLSAAHIAKQLAADVEKTIGNLTAMEREGLITCSKGKYRVS